MAKRRYEVILAGDAGQLKKALGAADKALGKSGSKWKSFGKAAAIGAGGALVAGAAVAKGFVDAAKDAEVSQAKVKTMVNNAGISYAKHAKNIDNVIQKQSKMSGFDDEDLAESLANMVRTTGSLSKAYELNNTVMDIARTKGVSLAAAQSLVARVYNGNYMGLKKLGIAYVPTTKNVDKLKASTKKATAEQLKAAKAADMVANRQAATALLHKKFGGQAEAYGKTAAGAQDRFRVAVENLKESIGAKLLPVVTKVTEAVVGFVLQMQNGKGAGGRFAAIVTAAFERTKAVIATVVKAVRDVVKGFQDNRSWALSLTSALAGLAAGFAAYKAYVLVTKAWAAATKAMAAAQLALNTAMKANAIGLALAAIVAVVAIVVLLQKKTNFLGKAWDALKGAFQSVASFITGTFTKALGAVKDAAHKGLLGPIPLIIARWGEITGFFKKLPGKVVGFLKSLPGKMRDVGGNVVNGIIEGIKDKAGDLVAAIKKWVTDKIPGFMKKFLHIKSPSGVTKEIGEYVIAGLVKGLTSNPQSVADAAHKGMLFPLEQAMADMQASRDKIEAAWARKDSNAERGRLTGALSSAKGKKVTKEFSSDDKRKGIREATQALREFDEQARRTRKLSAIDVRIKGAEQLARYRDTLKGIASTLKGTISSALSEFGSKWESTVGKAFDKATETAIVNGPAAKHLAELQAESDRITREAEDASNTKALADAKASHDPAAVAAAQAQIEETARQRAITTAQAEADAERARIESERADARESQYTKDSEAFERKLTTDLNNEYASLQARQISYATFAKNVNATLAAYGLADAFDVDADAEAVIGAGPGNKTPKKKATKKAKKKAVGGLLGFGTFRVGELGPEEIYRRQDGNLAVRQASQSGGGGGGGVHFHGPVSIGSQRAAEAMANKLAFRLRFG